MNENQQKLAQLWKFVRVSEQSPLQTTLRETFEASLQSEDTAVWLKNARDLENRIARCTGMFQSGTFFNHFENLSDLAPGYYWFVMTDIFGLCRRSASRLVSAHLPHQRAKASWHRSSSAHKKNTIFEVWLWLYKRSEWRDFALQKRGYLLGIFGAEEFLRRLEAQNTQSETLFSFTELLELTTKPAQSASRTQK